MVMNLRSLHVNVPILVHPYAWSDAHVHVCMSSDHAVCFVQKVYFV